MQQLWTIAMAIGLTFIAITSLLKRSKRSVGWLSIYSILIIAGYLVATAILLYTRRG